MQGDIYYVGVVYLNDVPIDCHFPKIGFHVPGGDEFHFLFNQRAAAQEGENTERVPLSYACYESFSLLPTTTESPVLPTLRKRKTLQSQKDYNAS